MNKKGFNHTIYASNFGVYLWKKFLGSLKQQKGTEFKLKSRWAKKLQNKLQCHWNELLLQKHLHDDSYERNGCLIRCCLDDNKIILGTKRDTPSDSSHMFAVRRTIVLSVSGEQQTPTQLSIVFVGAEHDGWYLAALYLCDSNWEKEDQLPQKQIEKAAAKNALSVGRLHLL